MKQQQRFRIKYETPKGSISTGTIKAVDVPHVVSEIQRQPQVENMEIVKQEQSKNRNSRW